MIPEIEITCRSGRIFTNSVTVEQYKKYVSLMERNTSGSRTDAMYFNMKIMQEMFGNRLSLSELGEVEAVEFLTASKGIHFIMQTIITESLLNIVDVEPIEKEESAFDEYDRENGYEEDEPMENQWKVCGEIMDRTVKIAIRILNNSYTDCMREDVLSLLKYLKFELDTIDENQK